MEDRIRFSVGDQKHFFGKVRKSSELSCDELGSLCGVSGRTFREWSRAACTPPHKVVSFLSKKFGVLLPKDFKVLSRYWYITEEVCRAGAFAREKKYGLLGDVETRRKGGLVSQRRRRENPEKYRRLGCTIPKCIPRLRLSQNLAELCGIFLGDGSITDTQVRVTLNKVDDAKYAIFVRRIMNEVLGELPSIFMRESTIETILSSISFVQRLEEVGLKRGNKVAQQVGIPSWIFRNVSFSKACVRGLIDTDGGVYFHRHVSGGRLYLHFGLCFSNASLPLLYGVNDILSRFGFSPSVTKNKKLYIYNFKEVQRYFRVFRSNNPKHLERLDAYLSTQKK